jgi:hypothetical protein
VRNRRARGESGDGGAGSSGDSGVVSRIPIASPDDRTAVGR